MGWTPPLVPTEREKTPDLHLEGDENQINHVHNQKRKSTIGTSGRHSSRSAFGRSTGNDVSGYYKQHYFFKNESNLKNEDDLKNDDASKIGPPKLFCPPPIKKNDYMVNFTYNK